MARSLGHARAMAVLVAGTFAGGGAAQAACAGAGVIVRIEGRAQDVVISRVVSGATATVTRPRVLEVICRGDVVRAEGETFVVLSIAGAGSVKVSRTAPYTVAERSGAPSVLGNAYSALNDQVMPDMKRMPWNVRLKGAGDDFGFALPAMATGGQLLQAGDRSLLVRLVGGTAPYKVEIRDAHNAVLASQSSSDHDVVLSRLNLAPGDYRIRASDSTPRAMDATITATNAPPPAGTTFEGFTDPEIRTAAEAATLARTSPTHWSFEAEQRLQGAPANGLDRDKVYELIESYSPD